MLPSTVEDVLSYISSHEQKNEHPLKRVRGDDTSTQMPKRVSATADPASLDVEGLVQKWQELEARWWVNAWLVEPDAAQLVQTSASLYDRCAFPPRFVRLHLDACTAPLITAWQLHNAGILPFLEWMRVVNTSECDAWGHALADLHARAAEGCPDAVTSQARSPHAMLLHSICRELVAAAAQGNTSFAQEPAVQDHCDAVLRAFVGAPEVHGATRANGKQPSVLRPALLQRSHILLRAARTLVDGEARSHFARSQLVCAVARDEGEQVASHGACEAVLKDLADGAMALRADLPLPSDLAHYGAEIIDAFSGGEGARLADELISTTKEASWRPGCWLQVVVAICRASTMETDAGRELTQGCLRALHAAAISSIDCGAPDTASGLSLAAITFTAHAIAGGGYVDWLESLTTAAGGDANDAPSRRAPYRIIRALCELVPVQSTDAIKAHLKAARSIHATWQTTPSLAASATAVAEYQSLLRARLSELSGGDGGDRGAAPADAAEIERADARACLEQSLARLEKDGAKAVPDSLSRFKFLKPKIFAKLVVPMLFEEIPRAHDESREAREARLHRTRMMDRLVKLLREKKMLPANAKNLARGSGAPAVGRGASALGEQNAPLPTDWHGLIDALPALAARAAANPLQGGATFRSALGRLGEALQESEPRGDAGDTCLEELSRGGAMRACGGSIATVLSALLEAFASCLIHTGSSSPPLAWAGAFVDVLLWQPSCKWPGFHRALWSWLRIACLGSAGASERPLALLLLHLGALQRTKFATDKAAPAPCAHCDSHASIAWAGIVRAATSRHGCRIDALMSCLPVGTGRERTWSMRLGAACIEHACNTFEQIDAGRAPMQSWVESSDGLAALGAEAVDGKAVAPPRRSKALLPGLFLQLMGWLADRDPQQCGVEERHVQEGLRRSLALPGAAELMQSAPPNAALSRSWDAISTLSAAAFDDRWTGQVSL